MIRYAVALTVLALPSLALADSKSSLACAAKLPSEAKLIYDKAAPSIRADTVIRDALPGIVRPMVISGSVARSSAKASGEAAGLCLKELQ
eukprot:gene29746-biopygen19012